MFSWILFRIFSIYVYMFHKSLIARQLFFLEADIML